ncbi:hypothetical protein KIM372_07300 [Bombiscardovia nodaiensis]|uniref:HTH tetR-type domain-containing protein n=1 Tax=Bombiscardovia nodaiensis TaxID=2932181 RepID=A0ABN6SBJ0_9BIFI|nr:hypothetical protein KIM372_07300 [Bombiscardovia nodaiensis]
MVCMTARKKDNLRKRQEFIDTATELFGQYGVDGTSLRDVIKASNGGKGVSPSVFYYYFDSKDDLINACMDSYMGSYARSIIAAFDDDGQSTQDMIDNVLVCVGQAWEGLKEFFPSANERDDWVSRFDRLFVDALLSSITPSMTHALAKALDQGDLPVTQLSRQVGPSGLAALLCTGTSTICRQLQDPVSQSAQQVEMLVGTYARQLLGLVQD